ncbi:cytochrome-c peroxidase [bacterium]|nr:cytochrome-c peroxidase [bacterium]
MKQTHFSCFLWTALWALGACSPDDAKDPTPQPDPISSRFNFDLNELPEYFAGEPTHYALDPSNSNTPPSNLPTAEGITLGRVLFYDKALSLEQTLACADCHQASMGFGDTARFSLGFSGGRTGAHSMRLANAVYFGSGQMFWDRRAATLEAQTTEPIQDRIEMGFDANQGGLDSLVRRLEQTDYYPILFEAAFGDRTLNPERIQKTLAQFVRALQSYDSPFDQGFASVFNPALGDGGLMIPFPNYSTAENNGKRLFLLPPNQGGAGCQGCHVAPSFAYNPAAHSNGLDPGETVFFKSPSLKNVGRDGHFMHDGRFSNLVEVVEHYNSGIQYGIALDQRLLVGNTQNPLRLNLTPTEKADLVAFLKTLDDPVLATDPKFADPFLSH